MKSFILMFVILCSSLPAYSEEVKMQATDTLEENKQLVRRLYEDCINTGKLELLADVVAEDYTGPGGQQGPSGFAENISALRNGFPDIHFTLEDLIAEGNRVTVRWQWKGTHQGTFGGFAASQKQVTNDGITIYQIRENKIVHAWLQVDRLSVLQQIGVIPKDLRALQQSNQQK